MRLMNHLKNGWTACASLPATRNQPTDLLQPHRSGWALSSAVVELLRQLDLREMLARVSVVREQPFQAGSRRAVSPRPQLGQVRPCHRPKVLLQLAIDQVQQGEEGSRLRLCPEIGIAVALSPPGTHGADHLAL